jgi:hypothetical protein
MKINITILTLLFVISFQSNSQRYDIHVDPKSHSNTAPDPFSFTKYNSEQYGYLKKYATWYIDLNIDQLRKNKLLNMLNGYNLIFSENVEFDFDNDLPNEIENIWFYGNHLKRSGDVNLFFAGSFSDATILNFINNKIYTINNIPQLKQIESKSYYGHEIFVFEIKDSDLNKNNRYASRLKDGSFVFNNNLQKLRYLIQNTKPYNNNRDPQESNSNDETIMVMNLNNEIALESASLNSDKEDYIIQSQLFNKAKNILIIASMNESSLIINCTISTKSDEIASQLEKIINGITAVKSLKQEDLSSIESQIINNSIVTKDDEKLNWKTFLTVQSLKTK